MAWLNEAGGYRIRTVPLPDFMKTEAAPRLHGAAIGAGAG
jgi:hypothetical protein